MTRESASETEKAENYQFLVTKISRLGPNGVNVLKIHLLRLITVPLFTKCFIMTNFFISWFGEQFMRFLKIHQFSLCFNFGADKATNGEAGRNLSTSFRIHFISYTLQFMPTSLHITSFHDHFILCPLHFIYTSFHVHFISDSLNFISTSFHAHLISYTCHFISNSVHVHFISYPLHFEST